MSFFIGEIHTFHDADQLLDHALNHSLMGNPLVVNRINVLRNLEYILDSAQDSQPLGQWAQLNHLLYNPSVQYRMWQLVQVETCVSVSSLTHMQELGKKYFAPNNRILQRQIRHISRTRNVMSINSDVCVSESDLNTVFPVDQVYENFPTHPVAWEEEVSIDGLVAWAQTLPNPTPTPTFSCTLCTKSFTEKFRLRQHMSTHRHIPSNDPPAEKQCIVTPCVSPVNNIDNINWEEYITNAELVECVESIPNTSRPYSPIPSTSHDQTHTPAKKQCMVPPCVAQENNNDTINWEEYVTNTQLVKCAQSLPHTRRPYSPIPSTSHDQTHAPAKNESIAPHSVDQEIEDINWEEHVTNTQLVECVQTLPHTHRPYSPIPGTSHDETHAPAKNQSIAPHSVDQEIDIDNINWEEEVSNTELSEWVQFTPNNEQQGAGINSAYNIIKRHDKLFGTGAIDHVYDVKFNEEWEGDKLVDILEQLDSMFEKVLTLARDNLEDTDLVRIIIQHDTLEGGPIVISLRTWGELKVSDILDEIQLVQSSTRTIEIDSSFEIIIGSIELPKGGRRVPITSIEGKNNSIFRKHGFIEIINKDNICMSRAIIMAWAKQHVGDLESPKEYPSIEHAILEQGKVPVWYYSNLRNKSRANQTKLATLLCEKAGVSIHEMASLNEVHKFEEFLQAQILVISASHLNKFIYTGTANDVKLYLYLVDDCHFHAIASITSFFRTSYFCHSCLQPYSNDTRHYCETTCIVCKSQDCKVETELLCKDCNMTCRSKDCFDSHKLAKSEKGLAQCNRYKKCLTCYKIIDLVKRTLEDHQCGEWECPTCKLYVVGEHHCYQRASPHEPSSLKHIYFDFETTTEKYECTLGYTPTAKKQCIGCKSKHKICAACIKCINCFSPSCGKKMHVPNYCVSQSVCDSCKAEPITADSKCKQCGSRCRECEQWDVKKKCFKNDQCPNTCGFRERIFQTGDAFCEFLFTEAHANFTTIAHNMKGFDGYFLLEYCIRKGLKVSKIIYAGSKIMAMHVGDSLNIRVIDSLNFLPMKLAALPKAFALKELKKGYFPHFFNLPENQNYSGAYPQPHYYGVDFMSSKDREQFIIWFKSMQGQTFNFRNEMEAYCRSDVDILRQACLCFRTLLMKATESDAIEDGIDPFKCLTIASVCMKVFKTLFL